MSEQVPYDFNPSLKHPFYFIRKGLFIKIKEHAPALSGKLMDFGCGAKPYKSLFTNVSEYVGVDYQGEGHSHASEQIDFFYDGVTLPFGNDTFDAVFSSEVFEHIFNLEEILPEINRVMKPGGKILITCPFVWNEHEVPIDYARYTRFALQYLLKKNNFNVLVTDKSGDFLSVIYQLRVLYFRDHLMPSMPRFLQKLARHIVIPTMNAWYSFWHKVWPKRQDLYQNNVILAEKVQ